MVLWNEEKEVVIFEKHVPDLTELALARFVDRARKAAGLKGGVDVLVTSDAEMKALNQRFRGKKIATDVLSFPVSVENGAGKTLAGEIAISANIAARNARALGHGAAEEVKILVLHGVLHLAGFNHESDRGQMAQRESKLRAELGLPIGLIERGIDERPSTPRLRPRTPKPGVSGAPIFGARPFKARTKGKKT